jgi:hypothetical protein
MLRSSAMLPTRGAQETCVALGDTWTWDGAGWIQHDVPGPSARYGSAIATLNDTVVLFGGAGPSNGVTYGDTWTWDGAIWSERDVT